MGVLDGICSRSPCVPDLVPSRLALRRRRDRAGGRRDACSVQVGCHRVQRRLHILLCKCTCVGLLHYTTPHVSTSHHIALTPLCNPQLQPHCNPQLDITRHQTVAHSPTLQLPTGSMVHETDARMGPSDGWSVHGLRLPWAPRALSARTPATA